MIELLQTDLVRRLDKWKSILGQIRERVEKVKILYDPSHVLTWTMHWDRQLYKVLEVHYCSGSVFQISRPVLYKCTGEGV